MMVAQQLYEGIDIGSGTVGLISYMRTDSVSLSKEAIDEIRALIKERYGVTHCPEVVRFYKTKSKMHKRHMRRFVRRLSNACLSNFKSQLQQINQIVSINLEANSGLSDG